MQIWILGFFLGVCSLNFFTTLPKLTWLAILFLPFFYLIDFKRNIFCIFPCIVYAKLILSYAKRLCWTRGSVIRERTFYAFTILVSRKKPAKIIHDFGARRRKTSFCENPVSPLYSCSLLSCNAVPHNATPRPAGLLAVQNKCIIAHNIKNCWAQRLSLWKLFCVVLSAGCCGFAWALICAHGILSWSLPKDLECKNLQISGFIASLPQVNSIQTSFVFKTLTINKQPQNTKVQLAWYGVHPPISPGDKWQLQVRLKRPHGTLNPGGFDYEKFLLEHHIRATGYVVANSGNQLLESHWYQAPLDRFRQNLQVKMRHFLLQDSLAGIITTLVIGDESHITQDAWQTFRTTGTSYLVAISGLHIGLVGSIVFWITQFCWRRSKRLPLVLPAKCAAAIAAFIIALLYSAVSGFSIPTQRAMLMLSVFLGALFFRRYLPAGTSLLIALLAVLLFDPLAVLSIGFWLSFGAVAIIIYATAGRKHLTKIENPILQNIQQTISRFGQMQFAVTLGLLPLTLLFFQQVSLISLAANVIALPGVCLVVVPLALLGALVLVFSGYLGGWILWLATKIMHLIWLWLTWLAQFSSLTWQHVVFNWWILGTTCVGILLLLAPRRFPGKLLGIIWWLPLLLYQPSGPKDGELWFTLLDVGQGLASVVQTAQHTLIYDTGLKLFASDSGANIVVPYLLNAGINDISMLVVSHGDSDHAGGAHSILTTMRVDRVFSSVPEIIAPGRAEHCYAGQSWSWDGIGFQFLSPAKNSSFAGNNASCVLKVSANNNSVLLTGDIEKDAEKELLAQLNLRANILVAPHHGSATSSTKNFITAVNPQYVLFPVGYHNRFHFPAKSVIKRYQTITQQLLLTTNTGAIIFKIAPKSNIISSQLFRKTNKHWWNE